MSRDTIKFEIIEETLALVHLHRPEAHNAMDARQTREFASVVEEIAGNPAIRAVILTGSGRAFCAGGDLAAFQGAENAEEFVRGQAREFHRAIWTIQEMDAPWIAAINGPCYGVGLSLACACDFRIAAETATFSVAFLGVGLSPDSGLTFNLPKIIGWSHATAMALLNRPVNARSAEKMGLLIKTFTPDGLMDGALELARMVTQLAPKAVGATKRLLRDAYTMDLKAHLEAEEAAVAECAATEDFQEGCLAFLEGRKPHFEGK